MNDYNETKDKTIVKINIKFKNIITLAKYGMKLLEMPRKC